VKVLVAHASRMGSTAEIAQHIAAQLSGAGHDVDTSPCAQAPGAEGYDAVLVGSALYIGRWDKSALRYLSAQATQLTGRPTWLFQSGPCGEGWEAEDVATPRAVRRLSRQIGLAPPMTFGGRLERARTTTWLGRWLATGAYAGDFRDWDQVTAWTTDVEEQLAGGRQGVASPTA